MPTPANALFALGLWIWLGEWDQWDWIVSMSTDQHYTFTPLLAILFTSAYTLNSSLPIFEFQRNGDNIRRNAQVFVVITFVVLIIFVQALALTLTVAVLPLISQAVQVLSKKKNSINMKFIAEINVTSKGLTRPTGKSGWSQPEKYWLRACGNVRIGKHITMEVEAADEQSAGSMVKEACEKLLINPVMEAFEFEVKAAK